MKKVKKCKHDFSHKGKLSCHKVKCKKCGISLVKWVEETKTQADKELYG